MNLTFRHLEYIAALAEDLHFGRAAAACGVSQPALSAQLKLLEEGLGTVLFERTRRRVRPTRAGAEMAARARRILRDRTDLLAGVRGAAGPLRLGVEPTLTRSLLPRLPADPPLIPGEASADRLNELLQAGELDAVLWARRAAEPVLVTGPLFKEHYVLVLPAGHALADREAIGPDDLVGQGALHLDGEEPLGGVTRSAGPLATAATLVERVRRGDGPAVLSALVVEAEVPAGGDRVVRSFASPPPRRPVSLAWRAASARAGECAALHLTLRGVVRSPF